MTGTRWLHNLKEREPDPGKRRRAMEARIRRKAHALSEDGAMMELDRMHGSAVLLHRLSVDWIGCWSQSLDDHLKRALLDASGWTRRNMRKD